MRWDLSWVRAVRLAAGLQLLFTCGCLATPTEIELTVDVGPEQVEVRALLRDIQLWTEDPVEALRAFQQIHEPEAPEAVAMLRRYPWMPRPQRWEWQVRGQALDLALAGSIPRSQFDACVAFASKDRTPPPEDSPCENFPLRREGEEYRIHPELEEETRRDKPGWMMLGPMRWPIQARRLQTSVRIAVREAVGPMSASALPSFQMHAGEPEAAASYMALTERYGTAFAEGDTPACKEIHLEARRVLPPRIYRLFDDRTRRQRLWLIERIGRTQLLPPVKSLPAPPEFWIGNPEYAPFLLPSKRPPELMLLRLVRLHDEAVIPFGYDWQTGRKDFSVSFPEDRLDSLCTELARGSPAWRRLCKHLVGTRQPPP